MKHGVTFSMYSGWKDHIQINGMCKIQIQNKFKMNHGGV